MNNVITKENMELNKEEFTKIVDQFAIEIVDSFAGTYSNWQFSNILEKQLNEHYSTKFSVFPHDRKIVIDGGIFNAKFSLIYINKPRKKKEKSELYNKLKISKWVSYFKNYVFDDGVSIDFDYLYNDLRNYLEITNKNKSEYEEFLNSVWFIIFKSKFIFYWIDDDKKYNKIIKFNLSNVTLNELYNYAKNKSLEFWNKEFDAQIIIEDKKWKNTLGSYLPSVKRIKFSKSINSGQTKEEIYRTLEHELVHWHLHTSNLPYKDINFEFIEECLKFNIELSGAKNAVKAYKNYCKARGIEYDKDKHL